ncbi:MAG TPA: hypothetical protein VGI64_16995 [Streptosporangiaceae bacterium]
MSQYDWISLANGAGGAGRSRGEEDRAAAEPGRGGGHGGPSE